EHLFTKHLYYELIDRVGVGSIDERSPRIKSIVHPILVPVCRSLQERLRKRCLLRQWICRLYLEAPVQTYIHVRLYYWILCRSVALLFVGIEPYVTRGRRLAAVEHRDIFLVDPFTVVAGFTLVECLELLRRHLEYHPVAIGVWVDNRSKIRSAVADTGGLVKPSSLNTQDVRRSRIQGRR